MRSNQSGFSLVEVMIGAGLLSALALGFASYQKHVSTTEAKNKNRNQLYELELQAQDFLKSRDICNQVLSSAFRNKPIKNEEVSGEYTPIKNKGYADSSGTINQKDVFAANGLYNGGKILLSTIGYTLKNLKDVSIPSSPWNTTGELEIKIYFQTCKDGRTVATKNEFGSIVKRCPLTQINQSSKVFTKFVSFQRNPAGIINPVPGQDKLLATCADSQDAVIEASQEYTDIKSCISEIKMHALMARPVQTKCNIRLEVLDRSDTYYSNTTINFHPSIAPNTLKAVLVGGGGGGGGGYGRKTIGIKREAGTAGKAGSYVEQPISDTSVPCKLTVGKGGAESNPGGPGNKGGDTKIECGTQTLFAAGGAGGTANALRGANHGEEGLPAKDVYGQDLFGSAGGSYKAGRIPGRLGGGGGGGDAIIKAWTKYHSRGTAGGYGAVIFKYKALKVVDPENILDLAQETELKKLVTDPPAEIPNVPPLVSGSSSSETGAPDSPCSVNFSEEIKEDGTPYTPEEIIDYLTLHNCPLP